MTKPSARQQTKIKLLPDPIVEMTSADSHHLIISEELDPHSKSKTYGKSMCVVSRVKGIEPNDDDVVLDHLTTDQVHLFARNIGVPNLDSKNKFVCHLAMASHFEFQHQLSSFGLSPTAWVNQTTANVCRAVNVIFSDQLYILLSTQMACTYCYLLLTHLLRPRVTATHVYPPSQTTVQFLLAESWREPTEQDNFTAPSGAHHNASLRPSWITGPSSTVPLPEQTHNVQTSSTVPTLRI